MSEQFVTTTKHFRKLLAAGYLLIVLLVGGIICTWLGEWRDLELLERENREINRFRKETHDAYVGVVELSLLGESVYIQCVLHHESGMRQVCLPAILL